MNKVGIHLLLLLLVGIFDTSSAQKHVTFFGSSICYGANAENYHGYGWQLFHSGAVDTLKYKYFNAETGRDNTINVEPEELMTNKIYPTNPNFVVYGLSLGNEEILTPQDDNGKEQVLKQSRNLLLETADSIHNQGLKLN